MWLLEKDFPEADKRYRRNILPASNILLITYLPSFLRKQTSLDFAPPLPICALDSTSHILFLAILKVQAAPVMTYHTDFINYTNVNYISSAATGGVVEQNAAPTAPFITFQAPQPRDFIVVDPAAPPEPRPFLAYQGPNVKTSRAWQEDPYRARRAPHVRQQQPVQNQPSSMFSEFQLDTGRTSTKVEVNTPSTSRLSEVGSSVQVPLKLEPIFPICNAPTSVLSQYEPEPLPRRPCRFLGRPENGSHKCRAERPGLLFPANKWKTNRRYLPYATTSRNRQPWITGPGLNTPRSRASGERARWSSFLEWDEATMALAFPDTDGSDEENGEDEEKYREKSNDLYAQARYFGNTFAGRRLPPPIRQRPLYQVDSRVRRSDPLGFRNSFYKLAPLWKNYPEGARRRNGGTTAAAAQRA